MSARRDHKLRRRALRDFARMMAWILPTSLAAGWFIGGYLP